MSDMAQKQAEAELQKVAAEKAAALQKVVDVRESMKAQLIQGVREEKEQRLQGAASSLLSFALRFVLT